ncbi:MAG: hypothetical protein AAF609_26025 [Cyanobacteria bacterium P01_C01_bin.120]
MSDTTTWYIVKVASETCSVLSATELDTVEATQKWGPYDSQAQAIARRVNLIRSGKCKPV